jgi:hypothetical protein
MELTDRTRKIAVLTAIQTGELLPEDLQPLPIFGMWYEQEPGIFSNGKGDTLTQEAMEAHDNEIKERSRRLASVLGVEDTGEITGMIVTGCTDPAEIEQSKQDHERRQREYREQKAANEVTSHPEPIPDPEQVTEETTAEVVTEQQSKPVKPVVFNMQGEIMDSEEKRKARAAKMNLYRDINNKL